MGGAARCFRAGAHLKVSLNSCISSTPLMTPMSYLLAQADARAVRRRRPRSRACEGRGIRRSRAKGRGRVSGQEACAAVECAAAGEGLSSAESARLRGEENSEHERHRLRLLLQQALLSSRRWSGAQTAQSGGKGGLREQDGRSKRERGREGEREEKRATEKGRLGLIRSIRISLLPRRHLRWHKEKQRPPQSSKLKRQ